MRIFSLSIIIATALHAYAHPATAETITEEIGRAGLAATESRLAALTAPTDADRFALGGVQFLAAIEGTFQDRWMSGLTDNTGMLPVLRLPIPENPAPGPFDPAAFTSIFSHAETRLAQAKTQLTAIADGSDFSVVIALKDLWFDVNQNAARDPGEDLIDIAGPAIMGWQWDERDPTLPFATIRFDVADAAWLAAYADLLSGLCNIVRAYDPTEPIDRIMAARDAMEALGPVGPDYIFGNQNRPDSLDLIAIVLATLRQTPDTGLMAKAQGNFLAMIAENRQFWRRVALETDDQQEWLPNDAQHSALGVELPAQTGAQWLTVLAELERVLKGELLLPYWRVGEPAGINLAKMFTDPRPIDVAGWIQGWAALPYLQRGKVASLATVEAFDSFVSGNAMLFSLYLN